MANGQPIPLTLQPGLYTETTETDAKGRWTSGLNVRFWKGRPECVGGWRQITSAVISDVPRRAIVWRALDGTRFAAFGTPSTLELLYEDTLHDITPVGLSGDPLASVTTYGFGDSTFGDAGPFGGGAAERSGYQAANEHRIWIFANWGEDLLALVRDEETVYHWPKEGAPPFTAIATLADAPSAIDMFVSDEDRHLVLLGADGDPMLVQWASQETLDDWTPTATNTAGDKRLEVGNRIMGSVGTRFGRLILTDLAAYVMRYVGKPFIFSITKVAEKCGPISPTAIVASTDGRAYWMGLSGFWVFDGTVQQLDCDVQSAVFDALDTSKPFLVHSGTNTEFREITWSYPTTDSADGECDRQVVLGTNGWWLSDIPRTTWTDTNALTQRPIATDAAGLIYEHDSVAGTGAGVDIEYTLTHNEIEIANGGSFAHVCKVIPDWQRLSGSDHNVTITVRDYPERAPTTKGPYALTGDKKDIRARGREVSLTFSGSGDFRMGEARIEVRPHGRRP